MAFGMNVFGPSGQRTLSTSAAAALLDDDYDSGASTDSDETARNPQHDTLLRAGAIGAASSLASDVPRGDFLFPPTTHSGRSSVSSSATSTPIPSRSTSPLPQFFSTAAASSSSCSSDTVGETSFHYLRTRRSPWPRDDRQRWWPLSRRRRKRDGRLLWSLKKWTRKLIRLPCFPQQPITIVLTLIMLSIFAISLTLLLMYILNPDKEPLPWRAYCTIPTMGSPPDHTTGTYNPSTDVPYPPFPPENFDSLPPAGVFLGVFSVDSAFERRSLIRSTWASHPRSREGAGDGDGGAGTSRTVVRFILGQPRKDWERQIKLEMDTYNDLVILPVSENMNDGKSHTFFSWASIHAWVPPYYPPSNSTSSLRQFPSFSYSNYSSAVPSLAPHDPSHAWDDQASGRPKSWVRPDFVVKADDDSFVMLAELEARLRLELHQTSLQKRSEPADLTVSDSSAVARRAPTIPFAAVDQTSSSDPLIYWGYLVTNRLNRFMAGELYALSWSIVEWVARDPSLKSLTRGAEDKKTAKWMKMHPRASEVRWASERCWIYDHPRAGTVYAHGFLFPSEVGRVRKSFTYPPKEELSSVLTGTNGLGSDGAVLSLPTPTAWAHSSVSTFGARYAPPALTGGAELTTKQSVEALVEGSEMSMLKEGNPMTPEYAWRHREGRRRRYENQRVGGTVVVHFIKKNMWYLETALALLEGEEFSEAEQFEWEELHPISGSDAENSAVLVQEVKKLVSSDRQALMKSKSKRGTRTFFHFNHQPQRRHTVPREVGVKQS